MLDQLSMIAAEAGSLLLEMQRDSAIRLQKGPGDFTLDADYRSQEIILNRLEEQFPGVPIVAEESDFAGNQVRLDDFFTVDPLDGTTLYSREGDEWGVMLSFVENGTPRFACVFLPAKGTLLAAEAGSGVFLNNTRLSCPPPPPPDRLIFRYDMHTFSEDEALVRLRKHFHPRLGLVRSVGSAASGCYEMAAGKTDSWMSRGGGKIWDFAPFSLLAAESGASCSSTSGTPLQWNSIKMTFATARTKALLDELVECTKLPGE